MGFTSDFDTCIFWGLWASKSPLQALMHHFITNEDLPQTPLVHKSSFPWKIWANVNCFLLQFITQDAWQHPILMNATRAPSPCDTTLSLSWLTATIALLWWCGYNRVCRTDVITSYPPFNNQFSWHDVLLARCLCTYNCSWLPVKFLIRLSCFSKHVQW